MITSNLWAAVWILTSAWYLVRANRLQRKNLIKTRQIRDLERTIEKLKSKNGDLWYQIMAANDSHAPEEHRQEVTVTNI